MLPALGLLSCLQSLQLVRHVGSFRVINKRKDLVELLMLSQPLESVLAMYPVAFFHLCFFAPQIFIPRLTVLVYGVIMYESFDLDFSPACACDFLPFPSYPYGYIRHVTMPRP